MAEVQHVVKQPCRKTEAEVHTDEMHEDHGQPRRHGMHRVENRRQEHERELDRLGDAREKGGQGEGEQQARDTRPSFRPRRVIHGQAGAREAEHHHRKETGHEGARARIAGEEALEVARRTVKVPDDEPGEVVEDVMQASDDQHAIEHAVGKQAERSGTEYAPARRVHAVFDDRPGGTDHRGKPDAGKARRDRDEAATTEEAQIAGQVNLVEAVVEQTDRNAQFGELARFEGGYGDVARSAVETGGHVGRQGHEGIDAARRDQVAHERGQSGRAMIFLGQAHRHAHCKQQTQVGEDRVARRRHGRPAQHVGLPEPQEQPGDRQYRNRQHQGSPELLHS